MVLDLTKIPAELPDVCRAHHVRRLRVFGSAARGDLRGDSDVDLLVDYEPGYTPSFFKIAQLSEKLRPVFAGREIDLILPDELHWYIRDQVLNSARTIYER
jgi:predicted nucleotidyltransferase